MAPKDDDAKKRPRRGGQDRGVPRGEQGRRRLVAHVLTHIYARLLSSIAGMIYAEYRSRRKSIGAPGPAAGAKGPKGSRESTVPQQWLDHANKELEWLLKLRCVLVPVLRQCCIECMQGPANQNFVSCGEHTAVLLAVREFEWLQL